MAYIKDNDKYVEYVGIGEDVRAMSEPGEDVVRKVGSFAGEVMQGYNTTIRDLNTTRPTQQVEPPISAKLYGINVIIQPGDGSIRMSSSTFAELVARIGSSRLDQ